VAGPTIHGEAFEGTGVDGRAYCFHGIKNGIAGVRIIDVSAVVQKRLKGLGEPGFKKQPFADRLLCAGRSDDRRIG
jgi:hypothetical protein